MGPWRGEDGSNTGWKSSKLNFSQILFRPDTDEQHWCHRKERRLGEGETLHLVLGKNITDPVTPEQAAACQIGHDDWCFPISTVTCALDLSEASQRKTKEWMKGWQSFWLQGKMVKTSWKPCSGLLDRDLMTFARLFRKTPLSPEMWILSKLSAWKRNPEYG